MTENEILILVWPPKNAQKIRVFKSWGPGLTVYFQAVAVCG